MGLGHNPFSAALRAARNLRSKVARFPPRDFNYLSNLMEHAEAYL